LFKLFIILVLTTYLNAGWMFINDDGSLSSYNQEDESYYIPKEVEKPKKIKVRKRVHKARKKVFISSKPIYQNSKKTIYLTFDDGPLNGTENVIDVLSQTGTAATMFMIGAHIDSSRYRQELFLNAIDEPSILVANHTYSHANGHYRHFYSSISRVRKDLQKMENKLLTQDPLHEFKCCRLAGRNVFRLSHLKKNDPAIKRSREYDAYNALRDDGFNIFGWDYQWSYNPKNGKPYKSPQTLVRDIERIYHRGKTKKSNKLILLMHDFEFKDRFNGQKKLRELITLLQDKGWSFGTLDSY
jgi:peptidoglycan/xylan/chitin deacetylase (PgdA/CDA1 family)